MDFINEVITLLHEEGLEVGYTGVDLDLRDYITDSIQFISFIVDIEKKFDIEFPDEYLLYDSICGMKGEINYATAISQQVASPMFC